MPQTPERKREYMRAYMRQRRGATVSGHQGYAPSVGSPVSDTEHRVVSPYTIRVVSPLEQRHYAALNLLATKSARRVLDYFGINPLHLRHGVQVVYLAEGRVIDPSTGAVVADVVSPDMVADIGCLAARVTQLEADHVLHEATAHYGVASEGWASSQGGGSTSMRRPWR